MGGPALKDPGLHFHEGLTHQFTPELELGQNVDLHEKGLVILSQGFAWSPCTESQDGLGQKRP